MISKGEKDKKNTDLHKKIKHTSLLCSADKVQSTPPPCFSDVHQERKARIPVITTIKLLGGCHHDVHRDPMI